MTPAEVCVAVTALAAFMATIAWHEWAETGRPWPLAFSTLAFCAAIAFIAVPAGVRPVMLVLSGLLSLEAVTAVHDASPEGGGILRLLSRLAFGLNLAAFAVSMCALLEP